MEKSDRRGLINWTRSANCRKAMSSPANGRRLRRTQAQAAAAASNEMEAQIEKIARRKCCLSGSARPPASRIRQFPQARRARAAGVSRVRFGRSAEAVAADSRQPRSRAKDRERAAAEDFRSGIDLIDRQFHDVLAKLGVEPVPTKGVAFDPNIHQAVQMIADHRGSRKPRG